MKQQNIALDKSTLTAEFFYSAFLGLLADERGKFIARLFGSLNKKAIAFTTEGKPLSKKQYATYLENISNQVKEGDFIDHSEIEKELTK